MNLIYGSPNRALLFLSRDKVEVARLASCLCDKGLTDYLGRMISHFTKSIIDSAS
jgi:hypothetical protein